MDFTLCPFCGQVLRTNDGQRITTPTGKLSTDSSVQRLSVARSSTVQKPVAAFALTVIPAIAVAFFGIFVTIATITYTAGNGAALGFVVFLFGVLLFISALMLFRKGSSTKLWGAAIIAFGAIPVIISLLVVSLFFLIFMGIPGIVAIIGGLIAVRWKPSKQIS